MTISTHIKQQIEADDVFHMPTTLSTSWAVRPVASSAVSPLGMGVPLDAAAQESPRTTARGVQRRANIWTADEHERFLHGLELYPQGPWKLIAEVVGTRTTRQTMTHAQKYRQKIERHQRMNEAITRLIGSVRSPLLFEGVTATKKSSRARLSPSPASSPSPNMIQEPVFNWDHTHDPEFHELLASLEPVHL